jgi:hypothetical protein
MQLSFGSIKYRFVGFEFPAKTIEDAASPTSQLLSQQDLTCLHFGVVARWPCRKQKHVCENQPTLVHCCHRLCVMCCCCCCCRCGVDDVVYKDCSFSRFSSLLLLHLVTVTGHCPLPITLRQRIGRPVRNQAPPPVPAVVCSLRCVALCGVWLRVLPQTWLEFVSPTH